MIFLVVLKFPFSALSVTVSHVSESQNQSYQKDKDRRELDCFAYQHKVKTKQNNRVSQIAISNCTLSGRNLQQTPSPIAQSRVTGLDAQIYTNLSRD